VDAGDADAVEDLEVGRDTVDDGDAIASDADADDVSEPEYWPSEPAPELNDAFYEAHPEAFAHISRWVTRVAEPPRPDTGHLGAFAVGNGHVFALLGLTYPLNTLHGIVGPTYERGPRFLSDYTVRLANSDGALGFEEEWAAQSLSAPVVITRGTRGDVALDTIDLAPRSADAALRSCLVRIVLVHNRGDAPSEALSIELSSALGVYDEGLDAILERQENRALVAAIVSLDSEGTDSGVVVEVGSLDPGQTRQATVLLCTGAAGSTPELPDVDAAALLDSAAEEHAEWNAGLLSVDLPDPMVVDLIEGMKVTLRNQMAATGASCPMSAYTRTWLRDNIGPALAWVQYGAHSELRAMMDYVYGAVLALGDLRNSYDADLDVDPSDGAPDWSTMGPLSGRVAAETPSYMVRIYHDYWRATADLDRVADRWGFLGRCVFDVGFGLERLLPFTGDETFRAAMNATFGLDLEFPHHEDSFSLNSQLLWLGSAERYAALAQAVGEAEDGAAADAIADEMRETLLDRYRLDDGCFSAFIYRETLNPWPAPFEDAALKVTWSGAFAGDDPIAIDSVDCLLDRVGVEPGVVQSPLHRIYRGFPLLNARDGVYTGMLPGYTLSALNAVAHDETEAAFNALALSAGTSGNFQEYMIFDDRSGLTINYDRTGALQDYTAKYRPWEGGINIAAVLEYLVGFEPDAPARAFTLSPHLPSDWTWAGYSGLRVADDRFDLRIDVEAGETVVRVTSHAEGDYEIAVRWDDTASGEPDVRGPSTLAAGDTVELRFD